MIPEKSSFTVYEFDGGNMDSELTPQLIQYDHILKSDDVDSLGHGLFLAHPHDIDNCVAFQQNKNKEVSK